jgi:hypothetical protein
MVKVLLMTNASAYFQSKILSEGAVVSQNGSDMKIKLLSGTDTFRTDNYMNDGKKVL